MNAAPPQGGRHSPNSKSRIANKGGNCRGIAAPVNARTSPAPVFVPTGGASRGGGSKPPRPANAAGGATSLDGTATVSASLQLSQKGSAPLLHDSGVEDSYPSILPPEPEPEEPAKEEEGKEQASASGLQEGTALADEIVVPFRLSMRLPVQQQQQESSGSCSASELALKAVAEKEAAFMAARYDESAKASKQAADDVELSEAVMSELASKWGVQSQLASTSQSPALTARAQQASDEAEAAPLQHSRLL